MIVFDFNEWILSDVTVSSLLEHSGGDPTPILPLQDVPEEEDEFIRYAFEREMEPETWWIETVAIEYEIWSRSYDRVVEIENAIVRKVKSNFAWRRFNDWQTANGIGGYNVQSLTFEEAADLPPPDEEGGKFGRMLFVVLTYTNLDVEYP